MTAFCRTLIQQTAAELGRECVNGTATEPDEVTAADTDLSRSTQTATNNTARHRSSTQLK